MKDNTQNTSPGITDDQFMEFFAALADAPVPGGMERRIMEGVRQKQADMAEKKKEQGWLLLTIAIAAVILAGGIFVLSEIYNPAIEFTFTLPKAPKGVLGDLFPALLSYLPLGLAISGVLLLDAYFRRRYYRRKSQSGSHSHATGR